MGTKHRLLIGSVLFSLMYGTANFADTLETMRTPQFAVGYYVDPYHVNPLIIASKDNGETWSFIKNTPLSTDKPQFLNTISCSGNTCVTGGDYGGYDNSLPLLLKTSDGGTSWSYITNIANLPQMDSAVIQNLICSTNNCLANGSFYKNRVEKPLLLISKDKGQSWKSINDFRNMPEAQDAAISMVNCEGKTCVGMMITDGTNQTGTHAMPIVSRDNGETWSYVTTIADLPKNAEHDFFSAKCKNNTCVAGGYYIDSADNSYFKNPLLVMSRDAGANWSTVKNINGLPEKMTFASINSLTHTGTTWVAAGKYGTTRDTEVASPFILLSNDNGDHWSYVKEVTGTPNKSTRISGVSCQGDYCVVAGYYLLDIINEADGFELPLLLVSNDRGKSYRFVQQIENLPPLKGATIESINCKDDVCSAIGHYDDISSGESHNGSIYLPMVLRSKDKGEHWSFVNIKDLPEMNRGTLDSISRGRVNANRHGLVKP